MDRRGLLAIIGGTGFDWRGEHALFSDALGELIHTRWGTAHITRARLRQDGGRDIVFLHRHADPHVPERRRIPPHKINYRANVAALKQIGVTGILASTAVGSLRPEWPAGTLVLLDQFIDCTTARAKTFFDEQPVHVDVTEPYCGGLRALLQQVAAEANIELQEKGTYLCTDGPRFETPAEIRAYAKWGADVVGMTGVPEAVLAREASISYAGVSIVTNIAAGISPHPLTQSEVLTTMRATFPRVAQLFLSAALAYKDDPALPARRATAEFATPEFDIATLFT
ncbi:MAG TPA: MTAP family purine nucleoside phosphorylase [Abditibacteriaceae bacterium]|nr:MTAP family purine nucleoside phosphorylase [Abditibacteriaceae bacterium]